MSSVVRVWSWGVIALASCAPFAVAACDAFGEGESEETPTPAEASTGPDVTSGNDGGVDDGDGSTTEPTDASDATTDTSTPLGPNPCTDANHLFCAGFDGPALLDNGHWPWTTSVHAVPKDLALDTTHLVSGTSSLLVSMFPGNKQSYFGYLLTEAKLRVTMQLRVTRSALPTDTMTGTVDILRFSYQTQDLATEAGYVGIYVTPMGTVGLKWGEGAGSPTLQDITASWDTFHEIHLDLDLGNGTAQVSVDADAPKGLYSISRATTKAASLAVGLFQTNSPATFTANVDGVVVDKL